MLCYYLTINGSCSKNLRRSGVEAEATGAARDDDNLALEGEERGEIVQISFRHDDELFVW